MQEPQKGIPQPAADSENPALASARDRIARAFEAMQCEVPPGDREHVQEWLRFEVTTHEVDVRYKRRWYCLTFSEYPDGEFGDGLVWSVDAGGNKHGPPLRLTEHQIGSIVDGMGDSDSST